MGDVEPVHPVALGDEAPAGVAVEFHYKLPPAEVLRIAQRMATDRRVWLDRLPPRAG